jgi:thioredoxin 1
MRSVTDDSFQADVLEADRPVLVDFTAAWCPPCRLMAPVLEDLARDRADLEVVELDVDANQGAAARYGVLGMPTFMLFEHGEPVTTIRGAQPRKRLEAAVDQALAQQRA